ncbi:PDR/VanB family oxidoreductase [Microbacterium sp. SORGH_AS_0888]|uniref:PDR/VanB family oxidoreductase n=1 Tax=Microbacterium sp. SORGH_AS_0888 TaxID=3041791 RepID=UPI00277F4E2D|nr:PDR/VanB family oxidoreductase [Microbacterium sp. SORGH_AS_0888]MDQ1129311.1 ferredoxin-NADP reductase [Microbacterium sp. SORGH_AS_0888]
MFSTDDLAARVRSMTREADGVLSVELEGRGQPLPEWTPGAHIDLVLPGAPVRQYSLCGEPGSPRYRIAVLREPDSRGGSRAVHERLRPGDEVRLRAPKNHFELEPAGAYLFIAGGIGITPLLPMVRRAAAEGARWRLLYLGATRERMAFLDELAALAASGGDVQVVARDENARADLPAEVAAHPDALVYACGPERMLSALREAVADPDDRLRVEYFRAPELAYEPGGPFRIRLERTGLELDVSPEESILEVMRGAGVDVLSDCEEGICGSCETRILEGEAEHRDLVLTAQERQRGDCLMVCVSRAACPVLVLDA